MDLMPLMLPRVAGLRNEKNKHRVVRQQWPMADVASTAD